MALDFGEGEKAFPGGDGLPRPPAPATPLQGLARMRTMRRNLLEVWPESAYRARTLEIDFLGRRFILLNDPADIDVLLNAHRENYERDVIGRRLLEPAIGGGLVLAEGEAWRRKRRTLAPAFQPRHIDRLVPLFHAAAASGVAAWGAEAEMRLDLFDAFRRLTLRIAARAMFSIEDPGRTEELAELVAAYQEVAAWLSWRDHVAAMGVPFVPQSPARRALRRRWTAWMARFVDERPPIASADAAADLLDLLRSARDADTGEGFSRAAIIDQVGTMMAAGFETTAVALFWTAVMLAMFPARQEALRAALCADDAAAPPAPAALRSAGEALAFVYETLRLYPPVYALSRRALGPNRIGETVVPEGAVLTVAPWVVHRHARLWEAPHRFAPERFLDAGRLVTPRGWIPFGAGPRICLGMVFALTEILVVLRVVLARWRLALPAAACPVPVGRLTLRPDRAPLFTLTPR